MRKNKSSWWRIDQLVWWDSWTQNSFRDGAGEFKALLEFDGKILMKLNKKWSSYLALLLDAGGRREVRRAIGNFESKNLVKNT